MDFFGLPAERFAVVPVGSTIGSLAAAWPRRRAALAGASASAPFTALFGSFLASHGVEFIIERRPDFGEG